MGVRYQLPPLALAIGLGAIALALLNTGRTGEGVTLGVVTLMVVRSCARRCADAYLDRLLREQRRCRPVPTASRQHRCAGDRRGGG